MAIRCQIVKFLKRRKLSAAISSMSKKFSNMLSGMVARMESPAATAARPSAFAPSRINISPQLKPSVRFCAKNSVMLSHSGKNRFTELYISCAGVSAILVIEKKSPYMKQLKMSGRGRRYLTPSAQLRTLKNAASTTIITPAFFSHWQSEKIMPYSLMRLNM